MSITIVNISLAGAGQPAWPHRPMLTLNNPAFIRGYRAGIHEATRGESAGIPLTDQDIVEALETVYTEGLNEERTYFVIGTLFGRVCSCANVSNAA